MVDDISEWAGSGKERRDEGIERVMIGSGEWRERYRAVLLAWFDSRPEGFRFSGETLRSVATEQGLEDPHHFNAWGGAARGLLTSWLREKKIWATSAYVLATRPTRHANSMRQYEKIVARRYRFADDENQMELIV
jgi:hypothetical protein